MVAHDEVEKIDEFPQPFWPQKEIKNVNDKAKRICKMYGKLYTNNSFKVIVLGDVSVGKTCVINRFCYNFFNSQYKATIGVDFEIQKFEIFDTPVTLHIWDTAGQERFKAMAPSYYRKAHAIILVFAFPCTKSLLNCEKWLKEAFLAGNSPQECSVFLVGNKSDLVSKAALENCQELGARAAQAMGAEFWSVSAKEDQNVKNFFQRVAAVVFERALSKNLDEATGKNVDRVELGTSLVSIKTNSHSNKEDKHFKKLLKC